MAGGLFHLEAQAQLRPAKPALVLHDPALPAPLVLSYAALNDEVNRVAHALRHLGLAPGGRLVLYNFGIDEHGRYLGHTGGVSMFDTFARLWRGLADAGVITEAEFRATNFPQAYRTVEEFAAPFEDPSSRVRKAGLRLEEIATLHTRCPFEAAFTDDHRDPVRFAREYIPTLRSWSEPTFVAGLDPARGAAEIAGIIDRFYGDYEAEVAARPEGHAMDYIHCRVVAVKEG